LKGDLTGINLNEANLKEADISETTLQRANLEGANLTKIQAIGTDFTKAYLTGACLEAWNIDSTHSKQYKLKMMAQKSLSKVLKIKEMALY
jgi:uncharacterized protein YjbI with pentapeptide repeats